MNLSISKLGSKGDGISLGQNSAVYIDGALPGERVKVRLFRSRDGLMRGQLLKVETASPHRQLAPCKHYEHCGNCSLQHLNENFYHKWKIQTVQQTLAQRGLRPLHWNKPIFLGRAFRRRANFSAVLEQSNVQVGYYRRRSQSISNISECLVVHPRIMQLVESLRPVLSEILLEGSPVDIFFQLVENAVEVILTGPWNFNKEKKLIEWARQNNIVRAGIREDEESPIHISLFRGDLRCRFGTLSVKLPPAAFLQPTEEGQRALVQGVVDALPKEGRFADLFSGCGTFAGFMVLRGSVDAYEVTPSAVQALKRSAAEAPLRVFRRDLFRNPLNVAEANRYDAIVFDPPRGGCPEQVAQLARSKVGKLIAVSCNPATFARDAKALCEGGFYLQSVQLIDQFLWSHHMEVIGVFTKRKKG